MEHSTVVAVPATWICGDYAIADLERIAQDIVQRAAKVDDRPAGLMPRDEWRSSEVTLPPMRIGAT
jgi:hypothetical protein